MKAVTLENVKSALKLRIENAKKEKRGAVVQVYTEMLNAVEAEIYTAAMKKALLAWVEVMERGASDHAPEAMQRYVTYRKLLDLPAR